MAGSIDVIYEDVSEVQGELLDQAVEALKRLTQPLNGSMLPVVLLPNPALEEVVLAGIIHGLADLWRGLREEGVAMVNDDTFPSLLGLLLSQPSFQQRLRRAAEQSLIPTR